MATTTTNPPLNEVLYAAETGDVDTIRRWIDGGGDPNTALRETVVEPYEYFEGETPLMIAGMGGFVELISILLQAGADVNVTRPGLEEAGEGEGETISALTMALEHGNPEASQLLLDHGADKTTFQWVTPRQARCVQRDHRFLRMFYIAGVDLSAPGRADTGGETFEARMRRFVETYSSRGPSYAASREQYAKILEVLEGVRLAGSYREFVLHDYKQLLRMRSLLARSRATMAPETPEVIRRLFGGTVAVPTRRSRALPKRSAFLPDPIFWKVMEFYRLGDWRRPSTLPPYTS